MNEIQTKDFVADTSLITNPTVIRVSVIRKKYLEQMESLDNFFTGLRFVGRTESFAVVMEPGNVLAKLHNLKFRESLRHSKEQDMLKGRKWADTEKTEREAISEQAMRYSDDAWEELPQLFTD
jgi:hypothetical protein